MFGLPVSANIWCDATRAATARARSAFGPAFGGDENQAMGVGAAKAYACFRRKSVQPRHMLPHLHQGLTASGQQPRLAAPLLFVLQPWQATSPGRRLVIVWSGMCKQNVERSACVCVSSVCTARALISYRIPLGHHALCEKAKASRRAMVGGTVAERMSSCVHGSAGKASFVWKRLERHSCAQAECMRDGSCAAHCARLRAKMGYARARPCCLLLFSSCEGRQTEIAPNNRET